MRDAINQTLKLADGLPEAQRKTFAQVLVGAATTISNPYKWNSVAPASKPFTLKVDAAVHNIGVGQNAGISAGIVGLAHFKDPPGRLRQALAIVSEKIKRDGTYAELTNGNIPFRPVEYEPGPVSQYLPSWLPTWLGEGPTWLGGDSLRTASKTLTDAFERAGSEKVNLMTPDKEHGNKPALERYGLLNPTGGNVQRYPAAGIGLASSPTSKTRRPVPRQEEVISDRSSYSVIRFVGPNRPTRELSPRRRTEYRIPITDYLLLSTSFIRLNDSIASYSGNPRWS